MRQIIDREFVIKMRHVINRRKSELLLIANLYQPRKIIRPKLVSFSFFMVLGNELRYEKMPNFVRLRIARRQRQSECESPEFAGVRQFFMTACYSALLFLF